MSAPESIAHYRITGKLGEGGMGEVYLATDTKLGREVAIKVLPANFAEDPSRMARFEREAQMLAALNHPNIAAIYGIEQGALIMELVEGDDLKGPLPIDTALSYARQIAEALEAAHEKGIVHRDLKPANIKVTPAGHVKLLDFGLAKATESSQAEARGSQAEACATISLAMTQAGMILGTAAYMSPEQARGKPVDKRADIWAFGVVLFEMLTGAMLYGGETVSDSMAAVITREPDWNSLPLDTPSHVRKLLQRCLRKDPKKRMQAIGDVRLLLDEPDEAPAPPAAAPPEAVRRGRPWWGYCAVALSLTLAFFLWRATRPDPERPMQRFNADLGPDSVAGQRATLAISPDGTRIVFPVQRGSGSVMLATRLMDQSKATILSGTEGASIPFFSPDGQWIGFAADQRLKKVSVQGGAPVPLCDAPALRGASWGEDGYIIVALESRSLSRVPEAGGTPQPLGKPEAQGGNFRRWPQVLPGSEAVLFSSSPNSSSWDDANIEVLTLKTGQTKLVQGGGYFGRYLPSGHLVYVHQGTLLAVPFDLAHFETRGMPAPVLDDVAGVPTAGGGQLDFSWGPSGHGTFAYLSGKVSSAALPIEWMDATGKKEPLMAGAAAIDPRFSPDGKRLAVSINGEIAVYDLERGGLLRLPAPAAVNVWPIWAPDGKHIAYAATGGLWWVRSDGSSQPQLIFESKTSGPAPGSFSPDGPRLAFHEAGAETSRDIWFLSLDTTDPDHPKPGAPELFLATKGADVEPAFSPDGRWLAYSSNESGGYHVFVRPFPEGAAGGQAQVSTAEGRFPIWSRNGKDLFYVTIDGHIMVAPYTVSGQSFLPGKPRLWAEPAIYMMGNSQFLDLAPDGKRFAVFPAADASGGDKSNLHITFLLNFFDELKRRMPPVGK